MTRRDASAAASDDQQPLFVVTQREHINPHIPEGAILFIDRSRHPEIGKIVVARHGGRPFFGELGWDGNSYYIEQNYPDGESAVFPVTRDEIVGVVYKHLVPFDLP